MVGTVNDIVTGTVNQENCRVTIQGPGGIITAVVKNRTFQVADFPLTLGVNSINAIATDTAGNDSAPFQLQITRQAPQGPQLQIVSGNDQTGVISTTLAMPLLVKAIDASGSPLVGTAVHFEVVRNNGLVHTAENQAGVSETTVVTDAAGQAAVELTLGTRVGAGNNRVEVSAPGVAVPVLFRASATHAPCDKLLTMNGENQVGAAGTALARPFEVVAVDASGNFGEGLSVTFTVEDGGGNFGGASSVTVQTNGDGRAAAVLTLGSEAGVNNNVVKTSSPSLTSLGATFRASAVVPGPEAETRFLGVVLDTEDQPIPHVKVQIENTSPLLQTFTDDKGQFVLSAVPVGNELLFVDGSTTTRPGKWPPLEFQINVVAGIDNTLGMPAYLPELNSSGFRAVGNEDAILEMPGIEGFKLKIFANSATFPGGSHTGFMGVTQVSNDQVPMPPPGGLAPAWVLTLQPPGVRLNPPAQLTMPNAYGLPPGQIIDIFSFDHDLQQFVSVGTATVQPDGATIVSDPGSGIRKSGWGHGPPPPPPPGTGSGCTGTNGPCPPTPPPPCTGTSCDDGNVCTTGDTCSNGVCAGTPNNSVVPPQNSPTDCEKQVCLNGSITTQINDLESCSDGNPLTVDHCENGMCIGLPVSCVDIFGNQLPNGTRCDDGSICTTNDECRNGTCTGNPDNSIIPPQISLTDCLKQVCLNGAIIPQADDTESCNDSNVCTIGDTCSNGVCVGTPNSSIVPPQISPTDCNKQVCLNGTITTQIDDSESCSDGDPSTSTDHCENGACVDTIPSCNSFPFDPATQGCCDGVIFDRTTQGCCYVPAFPGLFSGTVYNLASKCCGPSRIVDKFDFSDLSQCPNRTGQKRPPVINGCGSENGVNWDNPNLPTVFCPTGGPSFKPACDTHDACYDTCGSDKASCDNQLLIGLTQICLTDPRSLIPACLTNCLRNAATYAALASGGGSLFSYEDAQKSSCIFCCP